jgi:hypothetical protein
MQPRGLQWLVACGVVLDGLLAGSTVDRFVAGLPAWRALPVDAWAAYSRHADLGGGLVLYPVLAIGGALLAIAALVLFRRGGSAPKAAALPIYAGVVMALAGLLLTFFAAPNMLSLARPQTPEAVKAAFDGFYRWSALRGVFQVLLFPTEVWALVRVSVAV